MNSPQENSKEIEAKELAPQQQEGFEDIFSQLDTKPSNEDKVKMLLSEMKDSLSQEKKPQFKKFWEMRKLCLQLMKEPLHKAAREQFWLEYLNLSEEATRLKTILDEQASFALEQVVKAVSSLEEDFDQYENSLNKIPLIEISPKLKSLEKNSSNYKTIQQELTFLNHLAFRIQELKKEVFNITFRMQAKNLILQRIMHLGDQIFPKKKKLMQKLSALFEEDVSSFCKRFFQDDKRPQIPLFVLREEIKGMQNLAKSLTLNTPILSSGRGLLSQCWDKIRLFEKEKKKQIVEKSSVLEENASLIQKKFDQVIQNPTNKKIDELLKELQREKIASSDSKKWKKKLLDLRQSLQKKESEKQKKEQNLQDEEVKKRQSTIKDLRSRIQNLLSENNSFELTHLVEEKESIENTLKKLMLSKSEKMIFEDLIKPIKYLIIEKEEENHLDTTDEKQMLQILLDRRKQTRSEIKEQIEKYRKIVGGSGLDFDKAMTYQELLDSEKLRLDKINGNIDELEEKIAEWKN